MSGDSIPHPWISGWLGERSWTAPDEPQSEFISFDTDSEAQPFRMIHYRDMMFNHGELAQDYNFIDYFFGDPKEQIHARYYLNSGEISVDLPASWKIRSLEEARERFPSDVLLYFKKRFEDVRVLTTDGYKSIWNSQT